MTTENTNADDSDDGDLSKLILLDKNKLVLSERDFLRVIELSENPPPRTPNFERAMKRYLEIKQKYARTQINILDIVKTHSAITEKNIVENQVGTVLEILDKDNFLVEFAGADGITIAVIPLHRNNLTLVKK